MPVWLRRDVVLKLHDEQLQRHGGASGFLNEGQLDAALARPQTTCSYLPDTSVEALAASLAVGIAKGHPFVDGNKRTAAVASLLFLRVNGVEISVSDDELYEVFLAVADGEITEDALATWFVENSIPPDEL